MNTTTANNAEITSTPPTESELRELGFDAAATQLSADKELARKLRMPPLPGKEPPVILPKELLVEARQLKPEEIGDAVLKEVAESKKKAGFVISSRGQFISDPFGQLLPNSLTAIGAYEQQRLAAARLRASLTAQFDPLYRGG